MPISPRGSSKQQTDLQLSQDGSSEVWDVPYTTFLSIQTVWTGVDSVTTEVWLEASNNGIDFDCVEDSLFTIDSTDGSVMWEHRAYVARFVKVAWSANSSTQGTLDLYLFAKRDT